MTFWVSVRACAVGSSASMRPVWLPATTKSEFSPAEAQARPIFVLRPLMSWPLSQLAALGQWVVKSESWLDLEILFEKRSKPH